jgi:hypothetical protein
LLFIILIIMTTHADDVPDDLSMGETQKDLTDDLEAEAATLHDGKTVDGTNTTASDDNVFNGNESVTTTASVAEVAEASIASAPTDEDAPDDETTPADEGIPAEQRTQDNDAPPSDEADEVDASEKPELGPEEVVEEEATPVEGETAVLLEQVDESVEESATDEIPKEEQPAVSDTQEETAAGESAEETLSEELAVVEAEETAVEETINEPAEQIVNCFFVTFVQPCCFSLQV